jgi:arsenite/tail-anchored protein-transporting ATPase
MLSRLHSHERRAVRTQERMEQARGLFRNADTTQFVIVTIPTVMAVAESSRLAKALKIEHVPVRNIVINQVCQTMKAFPQ